MDPLIARNAAADKASAIRRRFLRESYGEENMANPVSVNLDDDLREVFNGLKPFSLTFTDLVAIQILREIQKPNPTPPPSTPAEPQVVLETPAATEPTT